MWRWCREGRIPCMKIGKHWCVRREELEGLLEGAAVFEGVGGLRVAASPLNDPLKVRART